MDQKCPPECQVKLNNIDKQIEDLKGIDGKQWEVFDQKITSMEKEMFDRVKTKTLIAVFGVIVTIFLAIMAMTFSTLHNGQKDGIQEIQSVQKQMIRVTTQLEQHTEHHNNSKDRGG